MIDKANKLSRTHRETYETEHHLHGNERWFELAAASSGTGHVADRITLGAGSGPFVIDAGNDTYGAWVQLIGSADTPVISGKLYYDPHKILVEATERNATYFLQFAFGASAAAGTAANDDTESIVIPASNQVDSGPLIVQSERRAAGTNMWARAMCPGQDTGTVSMYVGVHEYNE